MSKRFKKSASKYTARSRRIATETDVGAVTIGNRRKGMKMYFHDNESRDLNKFGPWFDKYPLKHRKDLRERFRSDDDQHHGGAFFELFLHELLTRLGFSLKVHPKITGASTTPDFHVCHGDQHFYLEATVTGQVSGPFTRNRNEQDVINKLNTLTSMDFQIGIHMEGKLSTTLGRERVVRPFKELLNAHNPDEVQRLIDEKGPTAAPSRRIECRSWSLQGWLKPVALEKRGSSRAQQLVLDSYRALWTNPVIPVRKALKKKARKYGNLDAPLVVAVNARDMFYNGKDHDLEVLLGKERLLYSRENPDLPSVPDRELNGVWSQNSRIDAVWRFQRIDFLNLWHNASACLYTNLHKTNVELPDALFRLPYANWYNGKMKWFDGEDLVQLIGVL